jgi:predicted AlkP superfamily phosphohydrolase/phosphomutase
MFHSTLYLDFDGVFNAKEPLHDAVKKFTIKVDGSSNFRAENHITFSPTVVSSIEQLRHKYHAELVWLTTWNENNTVLRLAEHLGGLDHGRVLPAKLHTKQVAKKAWTQWKAEAILTDQRKNPRPFVWVDDNAHNYWDNYVKGQTKSVSLFISPRSRHGLTLDNILDIKAFLGNRREAA